MIHFLRITGLLLSLFSSVFLYSQPGAWSWSRSGNSGTTGSDEAKSVTTDLAGNVIATGGFPSDIITFSSPANSFTLNNTTNMGTIDMWVAKYDPSGNILWAASTQGADHDQGRGVSTDATGNIFVTGYFQSPTLVAGTTTLVNSGSNGTPDMFIIKYSPAGQVLWARSFGGALYEWGFDVANDLAGNSFIAGSFSSLSVSFGTVAVINSGGQDAFLVKLDPSGVALWAQQTGGSMNDLAVTVDTDPAGNVIVGGSFESAALGFSPNIINNGGADVFVAKYTNSGNNVFSFGIGGPQEEALWSLNTDNSGNIYLAGTYSSNPLVIGTTALPRTAQRNMFTAAYSATGTPLWARHNAGNVFSNPNSVEVDMTGHVYVQGFILNLWPVAFGTTTLNSSNSAASYIMQYDALTGADLWGTTFEVLSEDLEVDLAGNLLSAGYFGGTVALGSQTLTGENQGEVYVAKMCMAPAVSGTIITACPGLNASYTVNVPAGFSSQWYSAPLVGTVLTAGNTFSASSTATYYLQLNDTITGCGLTGPRIPYVFNVFSLPVLSVSSGSIVALNTTSLNLQWYDCTYGSVISGNATGTILPSAPSSYALIYSVGNCRDTTDCFRWPVLGLPEDHAAKTFRYYPNPTSDYLQVTAEQPGSIRIYDCLGKLCLATEIKTSNQQLDLRSLQPGLYMLCMNERYYRLVLEK